MTALGGLLAEIKHRTPPSCIQVNILSMAMATNPNSEVAKMTPCIKYIKNIRSALSLLTKCLSGKAIGNLIQVKQLHYDETSHKGTKIMIFYFRCSYRQQKVENHLSRR